MRLLDEYKTQLVFSKISSETGSGARDCAIDFTNALEANETISNVKMTSKMPSVLEVSNELANAVAITKDDGGTIAIGKGVQFSVAVVLTGVKRTDVLIDCLITGNSGTQETYEVLFPVVDKLRE